MQDLAQDPILDQGTSANYTTGCPDDGTYTKTVGTVIFVLVWPFVVFDIKYYPVGRPGAAVIGGMFMVVFGIISQDDVYNNILGTMDNLQTLFLLIGMMLLSYYFDREGMLPYLARKIFGKSSQGRSFLSILWQVCLLSGLLSAFITNDATAVVLTPILINAHIKHGRAKEEILPLLLAIATSCNIGSAATIFGNPQNAFIASSAGVSLLEALIVLLPSAAVGLLLNTVLLYGFYALNLCWYKYIHTANNQTSLNEEHMGQSVIDTNIVDSIPTLQQARRDLYLSPSASAPNLASESGNQLNNIEISSQPVELNGVLSISEPIIHYDSTPESGTTTGKQVNKARVRKTLFVSWLIFITVIVIVLLAIPDCPGDTNIMFNLGLVPVAAGLLTMLVDATLNGKNASLAIAEIDWSLIALFMGLFVWLNGFEQTGFPCELVRALEDNLQLTTFKGVMLFTLLVSIGSNIFSNVPLVILIVDQLNTLCGADFINCHLLGGTILAWVSTIAGNLTLFGSICNIIVAEKSKKCAVQANISNKRDYQLSFLGYLLFGVISTMVVMFSGLPIVYFTAYEIRDSSLSSSNDACINATDF